MPFSPPGLWTRWQRSVLRRTLAPWLNRGDTLLVQAMPLGRDRFAGAFAMLWRHWTAGAPKGHELDPVRLLFLAANISALEQAGVPGAFAELGVWRGNSAKVIHTLAPQRRLYLFDTFAGFDRADAEAKARPDIAPHFVDTSAAQVAAFVAAPEVVRIIAGTFPQTAPQVPVEERFALVHLDCDLFQPTLDALIFFYPRLSPGGMVVVHDYGSGRWPGIARAVDGFLADKPEGLVHIPDTSGTVVFVRARG